MRVRAAASVVIAATLSLVLSSCMLLTPQQTARSYTPSDGVNGQVGHIRIRNVFLVTTDGTRASLIGGLENTGDREQLVTMQYASGAGTTSAQVEVPADGFVSLRPDPAGQKATSKPTSGGQVVLEDIDAQKGALFQVAFGAGSSTPVDLRLPVLTTSLIDYATLAPPTPRPTPTRTRRTPSPEATDGSSSGGGTATPEPTPTE